MNSVKPSTKFLKKVFHLRNSRLISFFAFYFKLFSLVYLCIFFICILTLIAFQDSHVLLIQKTFRGYRCHKRYVQQRKSAITLQKHWRGFSAKRRYKTVCVYYFSCKLFTTKTFIFQSYFNSNQNGTFLGYSRMGVECERPQLPKICGTNTAMMRIGTVIVYLKEVQKIYELRDALLYDR